MAKVLVVEDDDDLSVSLRRWLTLEQHTVEVIANGMEADKHLRIYPYDLIILDWSLPGVTGLELCKNYRANQGTSPILMLTGKGTLEEKEAGFDAGADDYLTKPFHMKELMARVKALLRRPPGLAGEVLKAGNLVLERRTHRVTKIGQEVQLLPKEFDLLEFFMRHPGQVFSAEALVERIWPTACDTSSEVVRTYVNKLRNKIDTEGAPSVIRTIHGVGYKFEPTY